MLFFLFLLIPLMEIATFVTVGGQIGLFWTLTLCVVTAMMGSALLRYQGSQALLSIKESFSQNRLPEDELFDGVCLVAAGALLLTPGFVTDAIGFLLFVPPFRRVLQDFLKKHIKTNTQFHMHNDTPFRHRGLHDPNVIDGEFQHINDDDEKK